MAEVDPDQVVEPIGEFDQHGYRHLIADRLMGGEHGREVDRLQHVIEVPMDLVPGRPMAVPLVERVDLGGVHLDVADHHEILDHVERRARFDAHGADRHLPLQFLHTDL